MGDGIWGIIKLAALGFGCVLVLNLLEGCKSVLGS
jgi:hypothetical protein